MILILTASWSHFDETYDCSWMGSGSCMRNGNSAEVSASEISREANQCRRGNLCAKLFALPRRAHGRTRRGVRSTDLSSRSAFALCQFRDEWKVLTPAMGRFAKT